MGGNADKTTFLSKLPPVLTIHVLRFNVGDKRKGHVEFEENLDLGEYLEPRSRDKDNARYRLVGVIEHQGRSLKGGHFVAYVRGSRIVTGGPSSWFLANDTNISEISLGEVLECDAFLLFYEKIEASAVRPRCVPPACPNHVYGMGKEEEEGARAVVKHSSSGKRKALCLEPTDSGRASQQDDVSSDSSREECKHFSFTPMEMYGFIDTIKYFNRIPQCNDCWREFTAGQQLALEESKSCFMVCSGCSQCFCTGSKTNEDWPMGHARPHANNSTCHPIALSIDHSDTAYCFQCDQSLNIKTWCSASLAQSSHKYGYVFRGIPNLLDQNLVQCLLWLDQIWMSQAGPFATAGSPGVVLKELFMKKLFIQKLLESLGVYNVRSGTFALQNSQKSNLHLHRLIEKLVKRPPDVRKDFSTVLDSNLQGRMSTTWTCKRCLHTAYENEAFYELRLTLPPKEHPIKTSALPEKSVTFSRAALMTNLRQLGKEEERKQASLPSIKKCLEYYFGKKVVVKRCEICEKTSTSISKDGGQMAANMNESASLDKDQTECHHKGKVDEKSDLLSAHENEKANQVGDGQNKQTDMGGYADKELFLSKLPTVLTLRVLRFKNNDKRTEHVKFEENLDVGEYMDLRSEDKDNTRYRLLRVIQHIGSSLAEGHCIAYLRGNRIASEQERSSSSYSWFCFDDLHARVLSLDEILEQEAWLLFYERIED